jgi:hypothetical protein
MPSEQHTLIKMFEECLPRLITETGFPRPPVLSLHHDGSVTMATMLVQPERMFETVMKQIMTDLTVREFVFAIDRYTQPDQGTKYNDILTLFWWVGERTENFGFRFGVVNYRPCPEPLIEPIDWHNAFWNAKLLAIVEQDHQRMMHAIGHVHANHPDLVNRIVNEVNIAATKIRGF